MKQIALRHIAKIPPAPRGFEFVSVGISLKGEALFLYIEKRAKNLFRRITGSYDSAVFPVPRMGGAYQYKLLITDGKASSEFDFPAFEFAFPRVDVFADGSAVIVGSRCEWRSEGDYDVNGMIVDKSSGQQTRFLAGDGIQDIGVDGQDRIWVSYFDEGVFGNFGWGSANLTGQRTPDPVGCYGLNCFNRRGEIVWRHDQETRFIDDCYALNVTQDATHFYFYSDFDLGSVASDFTTTYRKLEVSGASSFAISSRLALFVGGMRRSLGAVYLMNLDPKAPPGLKKCQLLLPNGSVAKSGRVVGRGSSLHFFTKKDWYSVNLDDL